MLKNRFLAFVLSIIMLLSFASTAESGYITISDPYYTDGETVYDLTGLSVNFSAASVPEMYQMILRVITTAGEVKAALEIEGENVSLYADGFSAEYTLTKEDYLALIGEALDNGAQTAFDSYALNQSFTSDNQNAPLFSVKEAISFVYDSVYGDGSQLKDAKTATVDTFLHTKMSTFMVPFAYTTDEVNQMIVSVLSEIEKEPRIQALLLNNSLYFSMIPYANTENPSDSIDPETGNISLVSLFDGLLKELELSVDGCVYYGENDIFAEINVRSKGEAALPMIFETAKAEKSALYFKMPVKDENGSETVLYATIEGGDSAFDDYVEIGVLKDGNTSALMIYQVYEDSETKMPVKDAYLGMANGPSLYNVSFVASTDDETQRSMYVSVYMDGLEIQMNYDGQITGEFGEKNEAGKIALATNFGVQARANIGFGTGENAPVSIVPEGTGEMPIVSPDGENTQLMTDFQALVNNVTAMLIMGVPGIASLMGYENAEG